MSAYFLENFFGSLFRFQNFHCKAFGFRRVIFFARNFFRHWRITTKEAF